MEFIAGAKALAPNLPSWAQDAIAVLVVIALSITVVFFVVDKGHSYQQKYFEIVDKQVSLEERLNSSNPEHIIILSEMSALRVQYAQYAQAPWFTLFVSSWSSSRTPPLRSSPSDNCSSCFTPPPIDGESSKRLLRASRTAEWSIWSRVTSTEFVVFTVVPILLAALLVGVINPASSISRRFLNALSLIVAVPASVAMLILFVQWLLQINNIPESLLLFLLVTLLLYRSHQERPQQATMSQPSTSPPSSSSSSSNRH
jgi:hypothetical protein